MVKELDPLSGVVAIPQAPFDGADRVDLDRFSRRIDDRPDLRFDATHRRVAGELIEDAVRLHGEIGWRPA